MVETIASWVHDVWSHWMGYVFSKSILNEDGSYTIPADLADRWQRQIDTFYDDLSEEEKHSDRTFVKEVIQIMEDEEASWD